MPIATPDQATPVAGTFVFNQGLNQGGARFARLEGCRDGHGRIYIVSTSGGGPSAQVPGGQGQVWVYEPATETLSLLFQSPGAEVLNAPDNICVSPRGGLVLCEDGSGEEFVHGLTVDGEIFPFIKNTVRLNGERNGLVGDFSGSEFAGACYSPDGDWLFVNIQSPGITFAISGPGSRAPCKQTQLDGRSSAAVSRRADGRSVAFTLFKTDITITMPQRKRIALIAHDNCKSGLLDWAR